MSRLLCVSTCLALAWFAVNSPLAAAEKSPPVPPGITLERDVEYGRASGESLKLDLARPAEAASPSPCVLVIHGGAWRAGSKSDGPMTQLSLQLAQRGYVAASVEYRFCPKYIFPAQVEDVKCAVRFLRANAEKYKLAPARFGAVGFSAGAHLSMMLGTMGKDDGLEGEGGSPDQPSNVQVVVAYFGPTDMAADDIPEISKGLLKDFLGGMPAEKPDEYKKSSPLTYVSAGDAPTLIYQGTKDRLVPHTQATKFADALTKAGVPGRVELLIGADHGWGGDDLKHTIEGTSEFLDRYLKNGKPAGK